jgi:transposase
MKTEVIKLSQKQFVRLDVINKAIAGYITVPEAALSLGLSERQIKRLKKEVKQSGPTALVHKNTLKKPGNSISDDIILKIVELKRSKLYVKANFTHFRELLEQHHGIVISYSALYNLLSSNGIKSPKTRRRLKPHRRRARRKQAGLLLQLDASPFAWFGGKAQYALHGAIDDATGQITALYICKNECLQGYFEIMRQTINNFGLPVSLYSDRHSIFRSPNADKISIEDQLAGASVNQTQFGRALSELGINIIYARSPQAKGRIERLWGTLQSRLPVELALRNITSVDDANSFLLQFIHSFNELFSVKPQDIQSAFIPVPQNLNIDYCLCVKESRILDNGGVFSFYNKSFRIDDSSLSFRIRPKTTIKVLLSPAFGIKVQYKQFVFDAVRFVKSKNASTNKKAKLKTPYVPPPDHPWRKNSKPDASDYGPVIDPDILAILSNISKRGYA